MRELIITNTFERGWKRIPKDIRNRANAAVKTLCANPSEIFLDVRKLSGIKPPAWRLRIGDYRIVFRITTTSIICLSIDHRKDVYQSF